MPESMKCVMIFSPEDSDNETVTKFMNWIRDNKGSAVADKYVPDAEQTRKLLNKMW